MDVSRKVLIITLLTFTILTVVFTFVYNTQLHNFMELEQADTLSDVDRVQKIISNEQEYLDYIVQDWACWNETYTFVEDRNQEFIDVNIQNETLATLKSNVMIFVNNSGDIVYAKSVDIYTGEEKPVPDDLRELIKNGTLLSKSENDKTRGFVLLDEGPMFVSCHPILTTEYMGPMKGTLIIGRYFDSVLLDSLKEDTRSSLMIYRVDEPMPPELQTKRNFFSTSSAIAIVEPLNEERVAGYFGLKDISGKPAIIMRADFPRDLYRHGENTLNYMYFLLLLTGFMTSVGVKFALDRLFISKLAGIENFVARARSEENFSKRLPLKDNDEFYRLSREINGMLNEIYLTKQEYLKEQELKAQEREKKALLDSLNELVVFISPKLDIVWANKSALEHMNTSLQETVGIPLKDTSGICGYLSKCLQIEQIFQTGNKISGEFTAKDGSSWFVQVTPVTDEDGKVIGVLETCRDITEKKEAERLLQEKKLAEIANHTKSEFLANMSHELRTPLNSIIGFSDILYEQMYGKLNEKQLKYVGNISKSGKHLLDLINSILDLSKVEAGKLELDYKEFELADKLRTIENILSLIAEKKNIKIEIEIDSKLTTIFADEAKFAQIMYNLLDNAIKFSYENGIVEISARKRESLVEISVKDTGIGIKDEDQSKLFKPFSQINSFSSKEYQGVGLGLSLVKQIVHLHGGYVWFRSKTGEGSTFVFTIPISGNLHSAISTS